MKYQTTLLELEYFPCVHWFTTFLTSEKVYFEQYEHFVRKSYRNRCLLAGPNGQITLSVPLDGGRNQRTKMKDVKICNDEPWQKLHLKTLTACYRRSAYFEYFEEDIVHFFDKKQSFLLDVNLDSILLLQKLLKLEKKYELTTQYEKKIDGVLDARSLFYNSSDVHHIPAYVQPFSDRNGFQENMSMLDMIFCQGKKSLDLLNV